MRKKQYVGPETGRVYDFTNGDKIDPEAEGIGCTEHKSSPAAEINGQRIYRRIFVRLRTPAETLTCPPIKDKVDFAQRVSIIEGWFDSIVRKGNFVLTFAAEQVTDEEADRMEGAGRVDES